MQTWTANQLCPILHNFAFIVRTPSAKESAFVNGTIESLKKFIIRVGSPENKKQETDALVELLKDAILHTAFTCIRGKDARIRKVIHKIIGYQIRLILTFMFKGLLEHSWICCAANSYFNARPEMLGYRKC